MGAYDSSKTQAYINVIRTYVIEPLERVDGLGKSCFAATMLVFAAIDGLGALVHGDSHPGSRQRFEEFLGWLGEKYKDNAEGLWRLRNDLMHSAMNVACFMSSVPEEKGWHLVKLTEEYLFVHTGQLIEDFKRALDCLEDDLRNNCGSLFDRAEERLVERNLDRSRIAGTTCCDGIAATTPPPVAPAKYVQLKSLPKRREDCH